MTLHDWTRVNAGIFHDFHTAWIIHLKETLKDLLPPGYYALAEQHLGRKQAVVVVDLFPPGRHDPAGLRAGLWEHLDAEEYTLPSGKPLTFASYAAGPATVAYLEHRAVGDPPCDLPLFLTSERYIDLPLATTY